MYSDKNTLEFVGRSFSYLFATQKNPASLLYTANVTPKVFDPFVPFNLSDLEVVPIPLHHGNVLCNGFVFSPLGNSDSGVTVNLTGSVGIDPSSHKESAQFVYLSDFRFISSAPNEPGIVPPVMPKDYENLTCFQNPTKSLEILRRKKISVMILDCLHETDHRRYISHSIYSESVGLIEALKKQGILADRVIFTGMSCTIDYTEFSLKIRKNFPDGDVEPGYDGMNFSF